MKSTIAPLRAFVFIIGITMFFIPDIHWLIGLGFLLLGLDIQISRRLQ